MAGEHDAVEIIGLAFGPVGAGEDPVTDGTGSSSPTGTLTRMRWFFVGDSRW